MTQKIHLHVINKNSSHKIIYILLILVGILSLTIIYNNSELINWKNKEYNEPISLRTNPSIVTVYDTAHYGGCSGDAPPGGGGVNSYITWNITTLYGPGLTWYIMNDSEFWTMVHLPDNWRTPGNFSYTELVSDMEPSASGIFYPKYQDFWWFVEINHFAGVGTSVEYSLFIRDDYIMINEPTSSNSWYVNSINYINWTWGGNFAHVNIDLYHDGEFISNIATNVENNGSYPWKIPYSISVFDDLYQINISNSEYPATSALSDPYFRIRQESILINNPNYLDSWELNTVNYINWIWFGEFSHVNIDLYHNGEFLSNIAVNAENNGSFPWRIPYNILSYDDLYQVNISNSEFPATWVISDPYFEIIKRTIEIINPSNFDSWETGTSHYINWDSTGSINNVKIELFKDDIFMFIIIPNALNNGSFLWKIPRELQNSTQYQIKITDLLNSSVYIYSENFRIFKYPLINPISIPGYSLLILLSILLLSLIGISWKLKIDTKKINLKYS